jgi:probable addiction module antidote protein
MSERRHSPSVSHHRAVIAELRADRAFSVEYLKAALEELDDPGRRAVGLLALRDVVEAHGGLAAVAREAGITREALYRALSPIGNPTLKTLVAVLQVLDMRLSVAPSQPASSRRRNVGPHGRMRSLPNVRAEPDEIATRVRAKAR